VNLTRRGWRIGAVVGGLYVLAVLVTLGVRSGHVRPLYEGFPPPAPYRWVDPPGIFAATNQKPTSEIGSIKLTAKGSQVAGIQTTDGQVVIGMATGAVAPHGSDTSIRMAIVPLASSAVGPLPNGLYPNGNVYRITLTYEPSGTAVTQLVKPGSMVIQIPGIGHQMYTSTDGHAWHAVDAHNVKPTNLYMEMQLRTPGYYLGGTTIPPPAPASSSSDVWRTAIGVGILAVLVLGATFLLVRRRRRRTAAGDQARPEARDGRR
jgi:hypothetical protein